MKSEKQLNDKINNMQNKIFINKDANYEERMFKSRFWSTRIPTIHTCLNLVLNLVLNLESA